MTSNDAAFPPVRTSVIALLFCLLVLSQAPAAPPGDSAGLTHIGSNKQLFIDDYVIQRMDHVKRMLNPAVKAPNNPIIEADRPWESNYLRCNQVLYDPKDGLFKMWYTSYREFRGTKDAGDGYRTQWSRDGDGYARERVPDPYHYFNDPNGSLQAFCFATSKDGFNWEKPNLGKVEFQGSRDNNILPPGTRFPNMLDPNEKDPSRRYKSAADDYKYHGYHFGRINLYHSPDGIEWTTAPENREMDISDKQGRWGPNSFMGWDPIKGVYVTHIESCLHRRCPLGKRITGRSESPDFIRWSEVETIMIPDDRDAPDVEFYAFPAFTYEGIYIGVPWIFQTTEGLHYPQLAFSRDGITYQRPFREALVKLGDHGDFDETTLYLRNPFFQNGRIWFYYSGGNWRGPEPLYDRGDKQLFAIGLATLPEDGFVSLIAGKLDPGKVLTRVITFTGNRLYVSMQAAKHTWGAGPAQVKVEILNSAHTPISGFTLQDADNLDSTGKHLVTWGGKSDVGHLGGKPVQLRFTVRNAKLNAFQFLEK